MKKLITTFFKRPQAEVELSIFYLENMDINTLKTKIEELVDNLVHMKYTEETDEKLADLSKLLNRLKEKLLDSPSPDNFIDQYKEDLKKIKNKESSELSGYLQQAIHTGGMLGGGLFFITPLARINNKIDIINKILNEFAQLELPPSGPSTSRQIAQNQNLAPQP